MTKFSESLKKIVSRGEKNSSKTSDADQSKNQPMQSNQPHPDFHPPYPRQSHSPQTPRLNDSGRAYTMDEIRMSSGLRPNIQQDALESELERIRVEAYGPLAVRSPILNSASFNSQNQNFTHQVNPNFVPPVHPHHSSYTSSRTSMSLPHPSIPLHSHSQMSQGPSNSHEQEMAKIRQSSGVFQF